MMLLVFLISLSLVYGQEESSMDDCVEPLPDGPVSFAQAVEPDITCELIATSIGCGADLHDLNPNAAPEPGEYVYVNCPCTCPGGDSNLVETTTPEPCPLGECCDPKPGSPLDNPIAASVGWSCDYLLSSGNIFSDEPTCAMDLSEIFAAADQASYLWESCPCACKDWIMSQTAIGCSAFEPVSGSIMEDAVFTCEQIANAVGCFDDLSTLTDSSDVPEGSFLYESCPCTCEDEIDAYLACNESNPPNLSTMGLTCDAVFMNPAASCDTDMSSINSALEAGSYIFLECPCTCWGYEMDGSCEEPVGTAANAMTQGCDAPVGQFGCDFDLHNLNEDFPEGTYVSDACPCSCSACVEPIENSVLLIHNYTCAQALVEYDCGTDINEINELANDGTYIYEQCPCSCTDYVPPTTTEACVEPIEGGVMATWGLTCEGAMTNYGATCEMDLHSLNEDIPAGTYFNVECPCSCPCEEPSPGSFLSIVGFSCDDALAIEGATCDYDIHDYIDQAPAGSYISDSCPCSCSADDCVEPTPGSLIDIGGFTCEDAINAFDVACGDDLHVANPSAPQGSYMYLMCPCTCADYEPPSDCDEPAAGGFLDSSGFTCEAAFEAFPGMTCETDIHQLEAQVPEGTMVYNECPCTCDSCIEPAPDSFLDGNDIQTCEELRDMIGCGGDVIAQDNSLPVGSYVWLACPCTCEEYIDNMDKTTEEPQPTTSYLGDTLVESEEEESMNAVAGLVMVIIGIIMCVAAIGAGFFGNFAEPEDLPVEKRKFTANLSPASRE